ncbi:hypothetical protein AVEN_53782-1 [Araneus ventricosus]|uniref:Retrotransposon gag domain-containing protein n=1 Tax=Araneus ventricosus TaxID=182803 RepID=A0A4Y2SDJ7_ARAVE|nr:hypothetical protein AVEN_53782-1 [Araneus ventricosus]
MRSRKQTERQQRLMESSLAYPRGKEGKSKNSKGRQNEKGDHTLGYLGVVMPVTPKEDVPLRGTTSHGELPRLPSRHNQKAQTTQESKSANSKREKTERDQTLGYLRVAKPVTPEEDVPLRGLGKLKDLLLSEFAYSCNSTELHETLSKRKLKDNEALEEYFFNKKQLCNRGNVE